MFVFVTREGSLSPFCYRGEPIIAEEGSSSLERVKGYRCSLVTKERWLLVRRLSVRRSSSTHTPRSCGRCMPSFLPLPHRKYNGRLAATILRYHLGIAKRQPLIGHGRVRRARSILHSCLTSPKYFGFQIGQPKIFWVSVQPTQSILHSRRSNPRYLQLVGLWWR